MIYSYILIISIGHTLLSFKKPLWGLCSLLLIKILIPDIVRAPLFPISLNTFCSLSLFASWLVFVPQQTPNYGKNEKRLINFSVLLAGLCIVVFVITDVDIYKQLTLSMQYFALQILPVIIAASVIDNKRDLMLVLKILMYSSLICMLYGLFCFFTSTPYPYNEIFSNAYYAARDANYDSIVNASMGGIAGRIMGTATSDTWSYGMIICILFTLFFCIYQYLKDKLSFICVALAAVSTLLTVRRTPIMVMFSFIIILFFLRKPRLSYIIRYAFLGGGAVFVILLIFPQLYELTHILETVFFFWNDSVAQKNEITGSSLEYRLFQLKYTLNQISSSPLFGNGWGAMYNGRHDVMNGWESILFTSLMQFGIIGFMIWMGWFHCLYHYSVIYTKKNSLHIAFMLSALVLCFVNDTIYPFFIFFGCVLLNKMDRFILCNPV